MKKVIQIGGNLRINGISSFIMTLYRKLYKEYQFIFINTANGQDFYRNEILALGGKVYDVNVKGKGLLRSLRQAKAIRKIIREEKPDVVHSHYYSNNGIYLKQAYREKVPVRISHCHNSNPQGLPFGKKIAKCFSSKVVKKYATHKFACSDAARKFLYGDGGEVIYNAIDYSRFKRQGSEILQKYGLDGNKKYFLFVGRFSKQKNIEFLLNLCLSVKDNTDINFLLVGHGELKESIETFLKKHQLTNVRILAPETNVAELLSISHALLLPSLYEGLPITLIEAQAVGVRCLVSDNITKEVQLGLFEYLSLNQNIWKNKILEIAKKEPQYCPCKSNLFDDNYLTALFDGIYSDINADEWILRGKEYSIGSKRFYRSKELAQACFFRAYKLGNIRGTFYYALGYFEGNGVEKDREKAQELVKNIVLGVEKYAKQNLPEYIVILGDMYSFGLGKRQSFSMAFELYSKGVALGNLEAMCDLGYMYLVGQGVYLDKGKSSYWYKKSADLGYVHSMRDIGQNYLNGDGVPVDAQSAVKYFKLASDNNYSHGTGDLAYCYLNGIGVEKDWVKAKENFLLALNQDAERTMRDLFAYGIDVIELTECGELKFLNNTEIREVSVQNTYAGTLCISKRIEYVDPACLYSSKVKKIFAEKDNEKYVTLSGVLFSKDKKILVRFPLASTECSYVVPNGVEVIGKHAFQNARNLQKIILPETLLRIEDSAFDDCKNLTEIFFPKSLTEIGAWAFHGCDKIKSFKIHGGISKIGTYAFGSCEALEQIIVCESNKNFVSINGNLYTKDKSVLLQYAIGKADETFTLPVETTKIAFRAVSDAFHLRRIDLNNVSVVEDKAFTYNTALEVISYCKGVSFGNNVFDYASPSLQREVKG